MIESCSERSKIKARVSVHWLAQCHSPMGLQSKSAMGLQSVSALIGNRTHLAQLKATHLNHWAIGSFQSTEKKRYMTSLTCRISPPATNIFAFRTVVLGLFKLNIEARHEIPEFLNANLWLMHFIPFDIDWTHHWRWNISLSTIFAQCSSSSSSTSTKWELITWNLGQILEIKLCMVGQ